MFVVGTSGAHGSIISFQVGHDEGADLTRQLSKYEGQVTATNLTSLPNLLFNRHLQQLSNVPVTFQQSGTLGFKK